MKNLLLGLLFGAVLGSLLWYGFDVGGVRSQFENYLQSTQGGR